MKQRFLAVGLAAVFTVLAIDCNGYSTDGYGTTTQPSNVPPNTVVMSGMSFTPASITIQRGTTITWRNDDTFIHTSTSDSTGWNTGDVAGHASATTQFNTAGTFRYHCVYHQAMGMVGTVVVQ
jgi:plastocyanin